MPARNAEKTLALAVISTLFAMGKDDELLVGLHRCTDSSEEILRAFSDARLVVVSFDGGSLSDVLNHLIDRASGAFIARMDSDDVCLPWRFSYQIPILTKRPGAIIFSTSLVSWPILKGRSRVLVPQFPTNLSYKIVSFLLPYQCPVMQPTMMVEAKTLLDLSGYRSVGGEDWDLWLRADRQGIPILRAALPTIVYRISPSQLSRDEAYLAEIRDDPIIQKNRLEGAKNSFERFEKLSKIEIILTKLHVYGLFSKKWFFEPQSLPKNLSNDQISR